MKSSSKYDTRTRNIGLVLSLHTITSSRCNALTLHHHDLMQNKTPRQYTIQYLR